MHTAVPLCNYSCAARAKNCLLFQHARHEDGHHISSDSNAAKIGVSHAQSPLNLSGDELHGLWRTHRSTGYLHLFLNNNKHLILHLNLESLLSFVLRRGNDNINWQLASLEVGGGEGKQRRRGGSLTPVTPIDFCHLRCAATTTVTDLFIPWCCLSMICAVFLYTVSLNVSRQTQLFIA